jgi:fumarate reductase flavoprotein subunit
MTMETQIAIIGGGGAGLSAAAAAVESGADVVLIEKRTAMGGNSAMAEGLFAVESPAQKRMNITATRDEAFRIAMAYAHWRLDARLVRTFIDKSGDTIDWLEKKGMFFDWIPPYYPEQPIITWHYVKGRGIVITRLLADFCTEQGVRFLHNHRAVQLLTGSEGALTGVRVLSVTGDAVEVKAKCVIVATGGYGGNAGLLHRHCPEYGDHFVHRGIANEGDGLQMTSEIGGATEGLGILQLSGHTCSVLPMPAGAVCEEPNSIWVNREGVRFIDETTAFNHFESINGVVRQPGRLCYVLFDQPMVQAVAARGIIKGAGRLVPPGTKIEDLEDLLREESGSNPGFIRIADRWGEIAHWMGIEPDVLVSTIEEYNGFCRVKHDDDFAKNPDYLDGFLTPPFYAIKCYPSYLGTIGGIKINHRMEVVNSDHKPIPGLFAAGSETGGWETDTYNVILSGSTFGFAVNSGRIAGEHAVQYLLKSGGHL